MVNLIRAERLASHSATKVLTPAIPYVLGGRSSKGTDCINLVGWCVQELGGSKNDVPSGSNTAWRTVMQWKGSMTQAKQQGKLVPGALVYVLRAPTEKWPDGDYGHVGVYAGPMPGFRDKHVIVHASTVYGVTTCPLEDRWTQVAWLKCVDYTGAIETVDSVGDGGDQTPEPPTAAAARARVVTSGGVLNIRRQPEIVIDNRVGKVPNGEIVDVLESRETWARIRYGNICGWAMTDFLAPPDDGSDNSADGDAVCPRCGAKK